MDRTDGSVSSVPACHKACLPSAAGLEIACDVARHLLEPSGDSGSLSKVLKGLVLSELV
jgi:hypothetical protein